MTHFLTAINVVLPVFMIIILGYYLKVKGVVNDAYIKTTMTIVFKICLPGMLFLKVSKADLSLLKTGDSLQFVALVVAGTLMIFVAAKIIAKVVGVSPEDHGTFVQGIFRSNYVIIGYSVLDGLFGDQIVGRMALLVVTIVPLYNILAIWVLDSNDGQGNQLLRTFAKIVKNPLLIGIALGFVVSVVQIPIPSVFESVIDTLGKVGTPLGLLGIGAYFSTKGLKSIRESSIVLLVKLIIAPVIMVVIAKVLGFMYMDLVIIFVIFGSPTAITSFIMATALKGNSRLAANIVILTTAFSLITLVIGIWSISELFL